MPDLFSGDAVPEDFLNRPGEYDVMGWLGRHGPETWEPIVDAVVAALTLFVCPLSHSSIRGED